MVVIASSKQNMTLHRKPLERRTYSQDRYYALIKRQKAGKATFKELTELDEIVNRVPDIREKVIRESFMVDEPDEGTNNPGEKNDRYIQQANHHNLWHRIKTFLARTFTTQFFSIKTNGQANLKTTCY